MQSLLTALCPLDDLPDRLLDPQPELLRGHPAHIAVKGIEKAILDIGIALAEVDIDDVRRDSPGDSHERSGIEIHTFDLDPGICPEFDLGIFFPKSLDHCQICRRISICFSRIRQLKNLENNLRSCRPERNEHTQRQ